MLKFSEESMPNYGDLSQHYLQSQLKLRFRDLPKVILIHDSNGGHIFLETFSISCILSGQDLDLYLGKKVHFYVQDDHQIGSAVLQGCNEGLYGVIDIKCKTIYGSEMIQMWLQDTLKITIRLEDITASCISLYATPVWDAKSIWLHEELLYFQKVFQVIEKWSDFLLPKISVKMIESQKLALIKAKRREKEAAENDD